jgi:single-strand DNA-binding protein
MTDLNVSIIEGRLTSDVGEKDFGYISTGTAKLTIHVACNKSTKKGEEWVDETSFFDVTVLGKPAENLKSKIVKGSPVRVSGRLQQDRWQDQNGNNKSKIFIVADSVKVYPKEQKQNNSGNTSDFPEDFPWN